MENNRQSCGGVFRHRLRCCRSFELLVGSVFGRIGGQQPLQQRVGRQGENRLARLQPIQPLGVAERGCADLEKEASQTAITSAKLSAKVSM